MKYILQPEKNFSKRLKRAHQFRDLIKRGHALAADRRFCASATCGTPLAISKRTLRRAWSSFAAIVAELEKEVNDEAR